MHLLETYALCTGCKIKIPFIRQQPIPLPEGKYITFHGFSAKASGRQYKYWNEVLKLLNENNSFTHKIIQIGEEGDERYAGASYEYLGKTSRNSLAFLIKNATLHLGFDSFPMHLASFFDIKIVALFCGLVRSSGPYFSTDGNAVCLHTDYSKIKPSYLHEDPCYLINKIEPALVYESVLKLCR